MEIKLAEMELTMLRGGKISVTYFSDDSFSIKNESMFMQQTSLLPMCLNNSVYFIKK